MRVENPEGQERTVVRIAETGQRTSDQRCRMARERIGATVGNDQKGEIKDASESDLPGFAIDDTEEQMEADYLRLQQHRTPMTDTSGDTRFGEARPPWEDAQGCA